MGPHSSGLGPHVPLPEYVENMRKIAAHLQVYIFFTHRLLQHFHVHVLSKCFFVDSRP